MGGSIARQRGRPGPIRPGEPPTRRYGADGALSGWLDPDLHGAVIVPDRETQDAGAGIPFLGQGVRISHCHDTRDGTRVDCQSRGPLRAPVDL